MGMRSENPGKVPGTNSNWSVDRVEGGSKRTVYKAGECFGVYVHPWPSKPCVRLYTGGQLECPGCAARKAVGWVGYCPCYLETTGKGAVIIIHEDMKETWDKMGSLHAAVVSRGTNKHDTVSVSPIRPARRLETRRPERQRPADIVPWLLGTLWGLKEYAEWCEHNDATLPDPDEVVRINANAARRDEEIATGDPGHAALERLRAAAAARPQGSDGPLSLGDVLPVPTRNGKHKKED